MKKTTENILNLINNENFSNLKDFRKKVDEYWWASWNYNEMGLIEAIIILWEDISLLESIVKKDIFEEIVVFEDRNLIIDKLNNINQFINNMKNGSDHSFQFVQQVQSLQKILKWHSLDMKINWYPNYEKKVKDVTYLKNRYSSLVKDVEQAEELKKQSEEILNESTKNKNQISDIFEESEKQRNSISTIKDDINKRYEEIKILNSNVVENETLIRNKKDEILKFKENIEKFKKDMSSWISKIDSNLTNFKDRTDKIVTENEDLQKQIIDILGKAIWTKLYKSFEEKSKKLNVQKILWIVWIIVSVIWLTWLWFFILEELEPLLETGEINNIVILSLRIALLFPWFYLLYLTTSQFSNTVKLQEEYDFKSSVAVALHHFKDLVEDSEKEIDKNFLTESIGKIFESPTEKVYWQKNDKDVLKKAENIVSSVADITWKIVNK